MNRLQEITYLKPEITIHSIVSEGILCDSTQGFDLNNGTENIGNGGYIEL